MIFWIFVLDIAQFFFWDQIKFYAAITTTELLKKKESKKEIKKKKKKKRRQGPVQLAFATYR